MDGHQPHHARSIHQGGPRRACRGRAASAPVHATDVMPHVPAFTLFVDSCCEAAWPARTAAWARLLAAWSRPSFSKAWSPTVRGSIVLFYTFTLPHFRLATLRLGLGSIPASPPNSNAQRPAPPYHADKCQMLTRLGLIDMLTQPLHMAAEADDTDRLMQLARTVNALVSVLVADMQRWAQHNEAHGRLQLVLAPLVALQPTHATPAWSPTG